MFETSHTITFGDCDPAGILFYPHHFRLMDATFQSWLRARGLGQASIQRRLGAVGTGLLDADATFRAPLEDGDVLRHEMEVADWGERTLRLAYRGLVNGRRAVEGRETRGLFVRDARRDGRLTLAPLAPLRALLGDLRSAGEGADGVRALP
jgi:4-hydroxybenzoyl-CoA thioesterase